MPKLTERRHQQTKSDITRAAIDLFLRDGYDSTTMADVAEAADVSRRTVYRHFPSKEDLVFEHPRRWFEQFVTEAQEREPDESLRDLCRRVLLSIAATIQDNHADVLAAFSVLQANDSLSGTHRSSDQQWITAHVQLFTDEPGFTPDQLQEVSVVAAATTAATNTAIGMWALGHPAKNLIDITGEVLDQIDPIWPDIYR